MVEPIKLDIGEEPPSFTLPNQEGTEISLHDYRGKTVILYAYPAASTPGCTKQACDFRDSLSSLSAQGYVVLGLSPDKPEKLAKFTSKEDLNFNLLSDPDKTTLKAYGAYGDKKMYGKLLQGVIRSTFVIGPDGLLTHAFYNVKATGHVAKLRRDLGLE